MNYIITATQTIFTGFLGSFRGGEILTTDSTQLTRSIWAILFSSMFLLHGVSIWPVVALGVTLFLSEWFISHAPFQNMKTFWDYLGMFGVGLARGTCIAAALYYWFGTSVYVIPLLIGLSQLLAYVLGYRIPFTWKTIVTNFAPGTPTSEFLTNIFYFWSILAIKLATTIGL